MSQVRTLGRLSFCGLWVGSGGWLVWKVLDGLSHLGDTMEGRAGRWSSAGTVDQRVYMCLQHDGLWVVDFFHGA